MKDQQIKGFYTDTSRNLTHQMSNRHEKKRRQAALPPSVENPSYDRRPFAVLSPLQHNVLEHNIPELKAIHSGAHPTAMFYITTIIIMYLFGLIVILVHYMNSSYGKWTWTLSDVWDELQPSFCQQSQTTLNDTSLSKTDSKHKRSVPERCDVLVGEEDEVRFLPTNLDCSNVSSGYSGDTGLSDGTEINSDTSKGRGTSSAKTGVKKTTAVSKSTGKNFLSPSSANQNKYHQRKIDKMTSAELEGYSTSEYQVKSSSDATILTALTAQGDDNYRLKESDDEKVEDIRQNQNKKAEEIVVVSDEISYDSALKLQRL